MNKIPNVIPPPIFVKPYPVEEGVQSWAGGPYMAIPPPPPPLP